MLAKLRAVLPALISITLLFALTECSRRQSTSSSVSMSEYCFKGLVIDIESGEPISGASAILVGVSGSTGIAATASDSSGLLTVTEWVERIDLVLLTAMGYKPSTFWMDNFGSSNNYFKLERQDQIDSKHYSEEVLKMMAALRWYRSRGSTDRPYTSWAWR